MQEPLIEHLQELALLAVELDETTRDNVLAFRASIRSLRDQLHGCEAIIDQIEAALSIFPPDTKSLSTLFDALLRYTEKGVLPLSISTVAALQVSAVPDDESDEAIFADYLAEMGEYLEHLESELLSLKASSPESINSLFRVFHSIKGTAAVMEHARISRLAHRTEDLLELLRSGAKPFDAEIPMLILEVRDVLSGFLAQVSPAHPEEPIESDRYRAIYARLEQLVAEEPDSGQAPPTELKTMEYPAVEEADHTEEPPVPSTEPATPADSPASTIRVSVDRLDHLVEIVGELVVAGNQLQQDDEIHSFASPELMKKVSILHQVIDDLQKAGLSLRLVPIAGVFNRMRRVVREATIPGKSISLSLHGGETEIDRQLVDSLYEPLLHLVRNACDHGIEMEKDRLAAGKPARGMITLSACREGNSIVITVTDDGKGISPEKIRSRASELGLNPDTDLLSCLTTPGFSTADIVTDRSGRGVGLDTVLQRVRVVGGSLELETASGTRFILRLPLTLSILEGMIAISDHSRVIIPITSVDGLTAVTDTVSVLGRGHMLDYHGALIPIVELREFLAQPPRSLDIHPVAIVLRSGRFTFAVLVDHILGIQNVVVKSLGPRLRNLPGVTGSSIMGDGGVALILDPGALAPTERATK
jgi:two-component system chemotaxis sensor kinase CheA